MLGRFMPQTLSQHVLLRYDKPIAPCLYLWRLTPPSAAATVPTMLRISGMLVALIGALGAAES
jgi:hypothetical protein